MGHGIVDWFMIMPLVLLLGLDLKLWTVSSIVTSSLSGGLVRETMNDAAEALGFDLTLGCRMSTHAYRLL